MANFWLMKSEPDVFSFDDLVKDKKATWDGVRNYQARNFMKDMKKGDQVLIYHSNIGREVVGTATVSREHFPDPTTEDDRWVAVEIKPGKRFKSSVTLETIKSTPALSQLKLVTHSRLSVMPVTEKEYSTLLKMGGL